MQFADDPGLIGRGDIFLGRDVDIIHEPRISQAPRREADYKRRFLAPKHKIGEITTGVRALRYVILEDTELSQALCDNWREMHQFHEDTPHVMRANRWKETRHIFAEE